MGLEFEVSAGSIGIVGRPVLDPLCPGAPKSAHELDRWFVEEVIPLEPYLLAYLRRHWRDSADLADMRQDVYVRIYQAAKVERPQQLKSFIRTVARNMLIDRVRRSNVVPMLPLTASDERTLAIDDTGADDRLIMRQSLSQVLGVIEGLPARCREVIELRRLQGLSQRETAAQMGITEDTVERQLAKAMRRLADHLLEPASTTGRPPRARRSGRFLV